MCAGFHGTVSLSELEPTFSDVTGSLICDSVVFSYSYGFGITDQFKQVTFPPPPCSPLFLLIYF